MKNPQRLGLPRMPYKAERLGVIVGMLLGDASIVKKYPNNIVLCHSDKVKDYLDWKGTILSHYGYNKKKTRQMTPVVKGKQYKAFIVDFVGDDVKWFYKGFYDQKTGKRAIKYNFIRHLNQYGLAMWFMDDGNSGQRKDGASQFYCLNTQAFDEKDQKLLIKMLKNRFGLEPVIHKDKKYLKLYFGAKNNNAKRLIELVSPYIHPDMAYKLC